MVPIAKLLFAWQCRQYFGVFKHRVGRQGLGDTLTFQLKLMLIRDVLPLAPRTVAYVGTWSLHAAWRRLDHLTNASDDSIWPDADDFGLHQLAIDATFDLDRRAFY